MRGQHRMGVLRFPSRLLVRTPVPSSYDASDCSPIPPCWTPWAFCAASTFPRLQPLRATRPSHAKSAELRYANKRRWRTRRSPVLSAAAPDNARGDSRQEALGKRACTEWWRAMGASLPPIDAKSPYESAAPRLLRWPCAGDVRAVNRSATEADGDRKRDRRRRSALHPRHGLIEPHRASAPRLG